jgi:hypothetical protein
MSDDVALGQWLGVSHSVVQAMTYGALTFNGWQLDSIPSIETWDMQHIGTRFPGTCKSE